MGALVSSPWIAMSLLGLVYLGLIPFSWFAYRRHATQEAKAASAEVVSLRSVDGAPRD
jgi:CDP-diacylglycerol---serine O-phosphatidyltransferase